MSIYPLFLDGWDDASTWSEDGGYLYAQLTRNGVSDDDGPEFWVTPPCSPVVRTAPELAQVVAEVTVCRSEEVLEGMLRGAAVAGAGRTERQRLDLPDEGR